MRPLGRLIILVLVIGLATGGDRYWQQSHGGTTGTAGSGFHFPNIGGGGNGGSNGDIEVLTTANAAQSAVVLNANWVSSQQKQGAQAFLTFLDGPGALRDGIQYHFRPTQSGGSLSLSPQLANYAGQGFRETYTTTELPSYDALNEAASQWRVYVAHKAAQ